MDDRINERNRVLDGEGYKPWDLERRGVTDSDSTEGARAKLIQHSAPGAGGAYGPDFGSMSGGSGGGGDNGAINDIEGFARICKFIAWGVGLYLLACILWVIPSIVSEFREDWHKNRQAEISDKRIQDYSDFSALSDWPQEVQAIYKRQENKSLGKLLDEIPENINKLSPEKRHMLGAQIWFKISSKGTGAGDVLTGLQKAPHRVGLPVIRSMSLSLHFLDTECKKGVELACLDAAKSMASAFWYGKGSAREDWTIQSALDHLPSSGPLAHSRGVESLRQKLLATRKSLEK
jgi:hypothetical protein